MPDVDFKFDLDDYVDTPVSGVGMVAMLGFDDGGKRYYVQTKTQGEWFKESLLQKVSSPNVGQPETR